MSPAARSLVPLHIFPPRAGEVAVVTREEFPLVLLLHVTLQRPRSLERFSAAIYLALQLVSIVLLDHMGLEVGGVVERYHTLLRTILRTLLANVLLGSG